jgi:hypothetical protein
LADYEKIFDAANQKELIRAVDIQLLTSAASISWDTYKGRQAKIVMAGNYALLAPANLRKGDKLILYVVQNATGGYALSFASAYVFPGGAPTVRQAPGAITVLEFWFDGTSVINTVDGVGNQVAIPGLSVVANPGTTTAVPTYTTVATDSVVMERSGAITSAKILPHKNVQYILNTLTDSANITWDVSLGMVAAVTLQGNRTLANPTNLQPGMRLSIEIVQDATGGRTLSFGTLYVFPAGTPTIGTAALQKTVIEFFYDGSQLVCTQGASSNSGVFALETFTLAAGDITAGYVTLTGAPVDVNQLFVANQTMEIELVPNSGFTYSSITQRLTWVASEWGATSTTPFTAGDVLSVRYLV